jgi:peptide chain release factor
MTQLLQISSGRGPAECSWVVAQVLRILLEEARSKGLNAATLYREPGEENGTLLSAVVQVSGDAVEEFAGTWCGTIQWVGQSRFRKLHKRKNWFVAVNVVHFDEQDFEINTGDILFRAIRAGGPGGQHVNKVSTAIRAIHIPTGIAVVASESRSQLQNKKAAAARLEQQLLSHFQEERIQQMKKSWNNHNQVQRGNPIRVFRGSDFKPQAPVKGFKIKRNTLKSDLKRELLSND